MKTALLVACGIIAASTTASAGGYLGLALGTEPALNLELDHTAASGRSLRVLGGGRFENVSIEGALNGFGVQSDRGEHNLYQLSAALKLNLPLGNNFEGFGRVGLERTWLNLNGDGYDFAGNGYLFGAGFEYRLNVGVSSASVFVDYTIHRATLENMQASVGETSRIWGLGFSVGI